MSDVDPRTLAEKLGSVQMLSELKRAELARGLATDIEMYAIATQIELALSKVLARPYLFPAIRDELLVQVNACMSHAQSKML